MRQTVAQHRNETSCSRSITAVAPSWPGCLQCWRAMLDHVRANGLSAFHADEQTISDHLYTAGLPDPDLLIRTSGEMRVSNFLLWQIAYAEMYVTETLWLRFFTRAPFWRRSVDFQDRERRYGGLESARGAAHAHKKGAPSGVGHLARSGRG